ncbi:MAG: hypothetical protein KC492_01210, partial [Myxococcales bacterium]|nr:hypothetical protein [Myxococcales bacterium]
MTAHTAINVRERLRYSRILAQKPKLTPAELDRQHRAAMAAVPHTRDVYPPAKAAEWLADPERTNIHPRGLGMHAPEIRAALLVLEAQG